MTTIVDNAEEARAAVFAALRQALPRLQEHWPIRSLGVFGSFARGDISNESDVDLLIEFEQLVPLSVFLAIEDELAAIVGRRVDLATRLALKPYVAERAMADLIAL